MMHEPYTILNLSLNFTDLNLDILIDNILIESVQVSKYEFRPLIIISEQELHICVVTYMYLYLRCMQGPLMVILSLNLETGK